MTDQLLQDPTSDSVGKLLREAREARGISLEDVEKTLRISKRQLGKLESDHESLICDVYNVGFLRSYAKLLNLNENILIQRFKDQTTSYPSVKLVFPTPLTKRGMPSFRILALSLLVLVSVIVGYEWVRRTRTHQETPLVAHTSSTEDQETEKPLPLSEEAALPLSQEKIEIVETIPPLQQPVQDVVQEEALPVVPPPLAEQSRPLSSQPILLKVTEESWIEVKDDQGNIIVSRLFHPEETYEFKNSENFLLKTGNARGVHLISGEKNLTFPGNLGEVKSGISLNPEAWVD